MHKMPRFYPRRTRLLPEGSLDELRRQPVTESIHFPSSDISTTSPTPTPSPVDSPYREVTRNRSPLAVITRQLHRPRIPFAGYRDMKRMETKSLPLSKRHHLKAQRHGMWGAVGGKLHLAEEPLKPPRSSLDPSGEDSGKIGLGPSSQDRGSSSTA